MAEPVLGALLVISVPLAAAAGGRYVAHHWPGWVGAGVGLTYLLVLLPTAAAAIGAAFGDLYGFLTVVAGTLALMAVWVEWAIREGVELRNRGDS